MKTAGKFFIVTLIAAFFLTTIAQGDAFAWSLKRNIIKPLAKAASVVTKRLADTMKPIMKPSNGSPSSAPTTDKVATKPTPPSVNNAMLGAKFITDVSDNQKVKDALLLLKDKSPDIFNWVKQNLPARTKGNLQGVFVGDTRNTVQFIDEKQGRVMLSKDSVMSLSVVKLAGLIAHEVFHLVEYLNPSSIGRDRKFVQEYEADLIRAYVLNRLGEGAGRIISLKDPYKKRINGMDLTITQEITAWGANGFTGNVYDAGYISLAGLPAKGVTTSGESVEISYGATSASPATITDLIKNLYGGMTNLLNRNVGSGPPATKVTSGAAAVNQNKSPKTNLITQYEVVSKTISKATYSKYRNITYPPIAGPQGRIAPDVVNPNASPGKAIVNAGGK